MKAQFTESQLAIVRFCAVECKMQVSGEESVSWMVNAYNWALERSYNVELGGFVYPCVEDIRTIGTMVEPVDNKYGWRKQAVWVGRHEKAPFTEVPRLMVELGESIRAGEDTPADTFLRFENVHPFVDGNGRTGAILYNWLRRSLEDPVWPPDFWNDTRRKPGYGAP